MELWIQNDGFLQRLAQLSQDKLPFQPDQMEILRKDLQKQKAMEIMHSVFLSTLERTIFTDFDPRGEETLAALQRRLEKQFLPHTVPDGSDDDENDDVSHILELFQGDHDNDDERLLMNPYSSVYSEVLAAMVYEKFQNTDLRDRDEAKRLGRGIRQLFQRETTTSLTKEDVEDLCGKKVSSDALRRVYKF
jgi:Zn-dependent oligopeptidase